MDNSEDKKWLYDKLKAAGLGISYKDFENTLGNEEDLKWYYDRANNIGLQVGSYDDFSTLFSSKPAVSVAQQVIDEYDASMGNARSQEATNTQPSPSPTPAQPNMYDGSQFAQAFQAPDWRSEENKLMDEIATSGKATVATLDGVDRYPTKPLEVRYDESVREAASNATSQKQSAADQLNSLYDDINKQVDAIPRRVPRPYEAMAGLTDQQLEENRLRAAQRIVEDAKEVLEEAGKKGNTNFVAGLGRGIADKIADPENWNFGITDLADNKYLLDALKKSEKGEELTPAEDKLLQAATTRMAVNYYYSQDLGRGYKAGKTTAESIPFMLEFMINPVSASGSGIAKSLLKYGMKKFGANAVNRGITRAAGRLIGDAAAAAGMTATTGAARTLASSYEKQTENYDYRYDDTGNVVVQKTGDMGQGEALARGFLSNFLDNQSEMVFSAFSGAGNVLSGILPSIGKLSQNGFIRFYNSIKNAPIAKQIRERAKIGGLLEEWGEEVYNNFANVATGEMSAEDALSIDNNIDTFLGLVPTQLAFSAIGLGGLARENMAARKRIRAFEAGLSEEEKNVLTQLQDAVRSGDNNVARDYIKATLADNNLTDQEKKERIFAARDIVTAQQAEQLEQDQTVTEQETDASYAEGASADPSTYHDRYKASQQAGAALEQVDSSLYDTINRYVEDDASAGEVENLLSGLEGETEQLARNYLNSLMQLKGAEDSQMQDAVEAVDAFDQSIQPYAYQNEDGTRSITTGTYKDRPVYVIPGEGGNVTVVYEDGSREMALSQYVEGQETTDYDEFIDNYNRSYLEEKEAAFRNFLENHPKTQQPAPGVVLHNGDVTYIVTNVSDDRYVDIVPATYDAETGQTVPKNGEAQQTISYSTAMMLQNDYYSSLDNQGNTSINTGDSSNLSENKAENESRPSDGESNVLETAVEDTPEQRLANFVATLPKKGKTEEIDYNAMTPQQRYEYTSLIESPEIAAEDLQADIAAKQKQLEAVQKELESAVGGKRTEIRDQMRKLRNELKELTDYYQSIATPVQQEQVVPEVASQAQEETSQSLDDAVPDVVNDKASDARQRGYRMVNGQRVDRQEQIPMQQGRETDVRFSQNDTAKSKFAIVDATYLQPSHIGGVRNSLFFIDEAQPKDRVDNASVMAADRMARDIRPEEITGGVTAYTGSPVINSRGEVIQGNNRSAALRIMYQIPGADATYREYLNQHAEEFGLTPEQINSVQSPVLVRVADVTDNEAIRLGQMTAQDTESGGIERIKPTQTATKLGDSLQSFNRILLNSQEDDVSLSDLVSENGVQALKFLRQQGSISDTQYQSAFDANGNLTPEAKQDLIAILQTSLFEGGPDLLPQMFRSLPAKAQKAILSTFVRDEQSPEASRIKKDIQNAIQAFYAAMQFPDFAKATNYESARNAIEQWKRQINMIDGVAPMQVFDNFALELAVRFKGYTMKRITDEFNSYYDLVQGAGADLFSDTASPVEQGEAIRRIFNIQTNEQEGNDAVGSDNTGSEEGRTGSAGNLASGERDQNEGGPSDTGGRTGTTDESEQVETSLSESPESANERRMNQIIERLDEIEYRLSELEGKTDIFSEAEQITLNNEKNELESEFNGLRKINATSVAIQEARNDVNPSPTESQKEAGNYKKGHVTIDGLNITIENPKGSTRSGKDASGKEWSVTMQNDYGYIRGTKAVDGDHIDIFLSDTPTSGNVYVVDAIDQNTGEFDESKVMYGFNSLEEARDAYLSNYSEGWKVGPITEVSKEEFKKWIDSSTRKGKPFNEYKGIKTNSVSSEILKFREKKINELNSIKDEDVKKGNYGYYFDKPIMVVDKTKKGAIRKMNIQREFDIENIKNGGLDWMYHSLNELSFTEIENSSVDPIFKDGAKAYLSGNVNFATTIAYQKVYNDVRNNARSNESDSQGTGETQLDGSTDVAGSRQIGSGGNEVNQVGTGRSTKNVPGEGVRGEDSVYSPSVPDGERGNNEVRGEEPGNDGLSSGRSNTRRSRKSGGDGNNVRAKRGRGSRKSNDGENTKRRNSSQSERDSILDEIDNLLDDFVKAGKSGLSLSVVGMNPEQIEIAGKILVAGVRLGYTYIKDGIYKFSDWSKAMREKLAAPFSKSMKLTDSEIDEFIKDMWEYPHTIDGETKLLKEWASEMGKQELRDNVRMTLEEKRRLQQEAESVPVKVGDMQNIVDTLPYLLPQQQEDVLKAETQFFDESHNDRDHAFGKGYLFTNGTGTGKTYTGLGIVKRFIKQGKNRILILTPSQPKVTDWVNDAKNLGINLTPLESTKDKGEGPVITTFANLRTNNTLMEDAFDLIVYDESHRIMENKQGEETIGAKQHYMLSNKNEREAIERLKINDPFFIDWREKEAKLGQLSEEIEYNNKKYKENNADTDAYVKAETLKVEREKLNAEVVELRRRIPEEEDRLRPEAKNAVKKTKVVFLSATPFNTISSLTYAEGYIFSYPEENKNTVGGYYHRSPREEFLEKNFGAGFRFRYGRIESHVENPEALSRQEVQFSDYLENQLQTKSGRVIDSEYDYSRDFPTVTFNMAPLFNAALEDVFNYQNKEFYPLADAFRAIFYDYNYSTALFETMKIAAITPRIREHLAMGRKVVIFHRRKASKYPITPPFATALSAAEEMARAIIPRTQEEKEEKENLKKAISAFKSRYARLLDYEQTLDYEMPREQIAKSFGVDNVLYFSGSESKKVKDKAIAQFNDDNSGKDIIVIQEASGKEGISLHDTTGNKQRVLITLALPQSPITALQIEGRIYRIGNKSNAIFEYPLLGLNLETTLFGQKFNQQVSTTENLALGSKARNLRTSFAEGVLQNSGNIPLESQGVGGKEFDNAGKEEQDGFDQAVLDYYGNQKLKGKRNERAGIDYFPTPEPIGYKMVEWAQLQEGEDVLEPSAGHGAIARYVPRDNGLTAIEPSRDLFSVLQLRAGGAGRKFVDNIFEQYNPVNKHDVVLMNPPYGTAGTTAIQHVSKAFDHLNEGGRLIAIIPRGAADKKFEKWLEETKAAAFVGEVLLPSVTFSRAGTSVSTRIVVVDKVTRESARKGLPQFVRHDLTFVDKIENEGGLFEVLRSIEMPRRTIDQSAIDMKNAKKTMREFNEMKNVDSVSVTGDGVKIEGKRYKFTLYANYSYLKNPEKYAEYYSKYEDSLTDQSKSGKEYSDFLDTVLKMFRNVSRMSHEQLMNKRNEANEAQEQTEKTSRYSYKLDTNTATGAEMHLAVPREKGALSDKQYREILSIARNHGGYWNRYKQAFHFNTKEDAEAFIQEEADKVLMREGQGSQTDASVSLANDPASRIAGAPRRSRKQQEEYAARERRRMENAANRMVEKLGLDNVEIVTDASTLKGDKAKAKGFYSPSTGKITIVLPNHVGVFDVEQTILHEAVAHYGLRRLFGDNFDTFLDNVYNNASAEIRERINKLAKKYNGNYRTATEEYLASLAEKTDFENAVNSGWFNKIKAFFLKMLAKAGINIPELTDNELRYILWRSYENLAHPGHYRNVFDTAADVAKQNELKVGNYAESKLAPDVAAENDVLFRTSSVEDLLEDWHIYVPNGPNIHLINNEEDIDRLPYGRFTKIELKEKLNNKRCTGGYSNRNGAIFLFPDHMSGDTEELELTLWHETAHYASRQLSLDERLKNSCLDYIKNRYPDIYKEITSYYDRSRWSEEAVAYLFERKIKEFGAKKLLSSTFAGESDIAETFTKLINFIKNGKGNTQSGRNSGSTGNASGENAEGSTFQGRRNDLLDERRRIEGGETEEKGKTPLSSETIKAWDKLASSNRFLLRETAVDYLTAVEKFQDFIAKISKKAIKDYENIYQSLLALSSRNKSEMDIFDSFIVKPLNEAILKLTGKKKGFKKWNWDKGPLRDLVMYVYSKHGVERNRQVAIEKFIKSYQFDSFKNVMKLGVPFDMSAYVKELNEVKNKAKEDAYEKAYNKHLQKYIDKGIDEKEASEKAKKAAKKDASNAMRKASRDFRNKVKLRLESEAKELLARQWEEKKSEIGQMNVPWAEKQTMLDEEAALIGADITKDYSGLSSMFKDDKWIDLSREYVTKYENSHSSENINGLWSAIKNATDFSLYKQYKSGLVSEEYVKNQQKRFDNYIPLRGFKDEIAGDVYNYIGKEYRIGNPVKSMEGRGSEADNPFGSILQIAYSSISSGNKNAAKQRLMNLVLNHNTDNLTVVNRAWKVKDDVLDEYRDLLVIPSNKEEEQDDNDTEWVEAVAKIPEGASPKEIEEIMIRFGEAMSKLKAEGRAEEIRKGSKIAYRTLYDERSSHQIPLYVGGEKYIITITGNPRLAQAVNGELNPESKSGWLAESGQRINRTMAGLFTGKNAAFSLSNLSKDTIDANNQAFIKENPKWWWEFTKNQRAGFGLYPQMMKYLKMYNEGKMDTTDKNQAMFKDFMDYGGATGYTFVETQKEYAEKLSKVLNKLSSSNPSMLSPKWVYNTVFDAIEFAGQSAEIVNRFAAYKTSREMGRSITRSVSDAKEITVNFNRKGAGKKTAGKNTNMLINIAASISEYGRNSIIFWNANMQGKYRLYKNLKEHPVKTSATLVGNTMAIGGVLLPLLNNLVLPALYSAFGLGSDDDDVDYFDALTDWERTHNLCVRLPKGDWLKVPIAPDMAPWLTMGDVIGAQVAGKREAEWTDFSKVIIDATSPFSINWSYEGPAFFINFAPSISEPLLQNMTNTNFMGNPIAKKPYSNRQAFDPKFKQVFRTTSPTLVELSRAVNRIGGGNDVKASGKMTDWNPAYIQNLVSGYTGGYGMTFISIADFITSTLKGESPEAAIGNFPIVDRFYISGTKDMKLRRVNSSYYDVKDFIDKMKHDVKGYEDEFEKAQKSGNVEKMAEYNMKKNNLMNSKDFSKLNELENLDKQIRDYEKYLKEFPEDERVQKMVYDAKRKALEIMEKK